jgi:hypothetical protein
MWSKVFFLYQLVFGCQNHYFISLLLPEPNGDLNIHHLEMSTIFLGFHFRNATLEFDIPKTVFMRVGKLSLEIYRPKT